MFNILIQNINGKLLIISNGGKGGKIILKYSSYNNSSIPVKQIFYEEYITFDGGKIDINNPECSNPYLIKNPRYNQMAVTRNLISQFKILPYSSRINNLIKQDGIYLFSFGSDLAKL